MEKLDVHIEFELKSARPLHTHYHVKIDMGAGLTPRERSILFNSARTCHVHKMLVGEVSFAFENA